MLRRPLVEKGLSLEAFKIHSQVKKLPVKCLSRAFLSFFFSLFGSSLVQLIPQFHAAPMKRQSIRARAGMRCKALERVSTDLILEPYRL